MNCTSGWVKLYRSIFNWEWWDNPNATRLFIYCLLKANPEERQWKGMTIERGSFVTSLSNIVKDTHLTIQQVRTSLDNLKTTSELTIKTTNKLTKITITNYERYQEQQQAEQQAEQQANQHENNNNEEYKKIRSIKEKEDTKVSSKKKDFSFCDELLALGVKPIIANDWIKVRKGKHLSQTETAMNGIKKHLVDIQAKYGLDANDAIKICVEHSWGGCEVEFFKNVTVQEQPTLFQTETKWE